MKSCVKKCLGELIVSCQAYEDTPLYGPDIMKRMVQCAVMGGAKVVRNCWPQDVAAARSVSDDLVIVGINKVLPPDGSMDGIFITPTFESAKEVIEAGADIVAVDARIIPKRGKEELRQLLKQIHDAYPEIGIMVDCATYEECVFAAETGYVDIIGTTLSGLVNDIEGPDVDLVRRLKETIDLPVNAEGRIWELKDIEDVVKAGADMLTVGTAITRPHLITERFINYYNKVK